MHRDFAAWYRAANIEPSADSLPKRWAAIVNLEVGRDEIAEAARLFYGLSQRGPKFEEKLRAALQKADPTVMMTGNDQELAVLAGAVLVDGIETCEKSLSHFAALAAVCPAAKNLRKTPVVPAIPELATKALATGCADRFTYQSAGTVGEEGMLTSEGLEELQKIVADHDLAALDQPLAEIYLAVQKVQEQSRELRRQSSLQAEETDMLWWLLGEHSRDTKVPFSTYTTSATCLIAGKELADLTRELPGPTSAMAFLDRLIRANRKKVPAFVSIESAVNEAPAHWKRNLLNRNGIDTVSDLAPVIGALQAAARVPDGVSWSAIYKHATDITAGDKIAPCELADQVYLEGLLFRAWTLADTNE